MHQLRIQSAKRGHPVVGDALYGSTQPFGPAVELPREKVIALHARRLTIEHPFRKEPLTIEARRLIFGAILQRILDVGGRRKSPRIL